MGTYEQGYNDGLSCRDTHGLKTAKHLAQLKPINIYERGKKQAASDWLKKLA